MGGKIGEGSLLGKDSRSRPLDEKKKARKRTKVIGRENFEKSTTKQQMGRRGESENWKNPWRAGTLCPEQGRGFDK